MSRKMSHQETLAYQAALIRSRGTRVRYYRSFEFLIIDEFGFDKLERREYPESLSLLYKVVAAPNGRSSTAFITNVDFSQWTQYLGDPLLVMALLDRVVDSAITINSSAAARCAASPLVRTVTPAHRVKIATSR